MFPSLLSAWWILCRVAGPVEVLRPCLGSPELCKVPASAPCGCGREWHHNRMVSDDASVVMEPGSWSAVLFCRRQFAFSQSSLAHQGSYSWASAFSSASSHPRQDRVLWASLSASTSFFSPHLHVGLEWPVLTKSVTCYLRCAKHSIIIKCSHLLKKKKPTSSRRVGNQTGFLSY